MSYRLRKKSLARQVRRVARVAMHTMREIDTVDMVGQVIADGAEVLEGSRQHA
jgi:hypothetical protein